MTREEQEALTRVGRGTPMGELLRRYWIPVAASVEVAPGRARPVRLLGEDLALLRTTAGELGLVEARCPHRGASLAYGVVDDHSVRCPYHGWRFGRGGECLEIPSLGGEVRPDGVRVASYRAAELGGLVFAYLGPEPVPLLPRYDLFVWPGCLRDVGRALLPCNFLQIMENSVDPVHLEWLHGRHLAAAREARGLSAPRRYGRRHVEIGFDAFAHGIVKRRVLEGGSRDDDDWKIGHPLVFPLMVRVGAGRQHRMQIRVPVDDESTLHLWYSCYRPAQGAPPVEQTEVPIYEVPWRGERGEFLLDFVDGGDVMTWVTQGRVADRTRERLVASDRGVVLLRRMYLEQIERVRCGEDPLGTIRSAAENEIVALPQEREKYGAKSGFLAESIAMSHVRYSPLHDRILELLGFAGEG